MSAERRRTERDRRRRQLGQNFLADRSLIRRLVADVGVGPGDLVLDIGAGRGALTLPLARTGATVWAIEPDPYWADRLVGALERASVGTDRRGRPPLDVRVIRADVRRLRLPDRPYRVVANPPFGLTTDLLRLLLGRPDRGPDRADLVLERAVAQSYATTPPRRLRAASLAPWWTFELGSDVPRSAFRPEPSVDAAVLVVTRRRPSVLPEHLAPGFADLLRPHWDPPGPNR